LLAAAAVEELAEELVRQQQPEAAQAQEAEPADTVPETLLDTVQETLSDTVTVPDSVLELGGFLDPAYFAEAATRVHAASTFAASMAAMETNRPFTDEYELTYSGRGKETPAQRCFNIMVSCAAAVTGGAPEAAEMRVRPRSQASAGYDPDFVLFLKTAFAVSCKMSQDQTAHLTRTKDMSTRAAYEQVTRLMQAHKVAMAWSETARTAASSTRFDREIVEADSARFSKRKEVDEQGKPVRVHNGRTLVLKGRRTKSWLASGMAPSTSRGVKGMPPETCEEVQGLLQKKLGTGTVLAPDGAQAWGKASKTNKRPLLKGVSHNRGIFTPIAKLDADAIDANTDRMLRGETSMAALQDGEWAVPAGDNCAEGLLGCLKKTMRRQQTAGGGSGSDRLRTVNALSAAFLHRDPSFNRLLAAHKSYRLALES
ncbi:unnamed protein product, partial [Symbiodinium microadriaticum]